MIEYCLNNVDAKTRAALRSGEKETVERPCLQRCGECWVGSFLVVDGEPVCGSSHDIILDALEDE